MFGKLLGLLRNGRKPKMKPYLRQTPRTTTSRRTQAQQQSVPPIVPINYEPDPYIIEPNAARALAAMAHELDARVIQINAVQTSNIHAVEANEIRVCADAMPEVTRHSSAGCHDFSFSSSDSYLSSSDSSSCCDSSSTTTSSSDF